MGLPGQPPAVPQSPFRGGAKRLKEGAYWGGSGFLSFARWAFLTRLGSRGPSGLEGVDALQDVAGASYSERAIGRYQANGRAKQLLTLLAGSPHVVKGSLLIIGPRYENEIFLARALGWEARQVKALDLYSYSPLVDLGDMHHMPFMSSTFSAIMCGWTLSYSRNPQQAASEITRVLAPGGHLAIGVEVAPADSVSEDLPDVLIGSERIQSSAQIASLFNSLDLLAAYTPAIAGGNACWILRKP